MGVLLGSPIGGRCRRPLESSPRRVVLAPVLVEVSKRLRRPIRLYRSAAEGTAAACRGDLDVEHLDSGNIRVTLHKSLQYVHTRRMTSTADVSIVDRSLPDAATEPTVTIERAAQVLGIGRGSAYEAARRGEIPVLRIGKRFVVPTAQLLALLGHDADDARGAA